MRHSAMWLADHEADQDDKSQAAIRYAKEHINDRTVARALRAYESLAPGAGNLERMRVALFAVTAEGRVYFEDMNGS